MRLFIVCRGIVGILSITHASLLYGEFIDITQHGYEQYQDIIINNKVVKQATHNHKDNQTRYTLIQELLNQYNRPFTMLDLGASQGYYSFRTAHDYECVCVMIEGNNPAYPMTGTQLRQLCALNTELDNIILLEKPLNIPDMQRLSECEHFDVVLALNVLHWLGPEWRKAIDALVNMGTHIIVETPPQETVVSAEQNAKRKAIEDYLVAKGAVIIGQVKRHTSNTMSNVYLITNPDATIERTSWITPKHGPHDYEIISTFDKKVMKKHSNAKQPITDTKYVWHPGINLMTYKMYNGTFPDANTTIQAIDATKHTPHHDWMPNNMILQGKHIVLIDNVPAYLQNGQTVPKRRYSKKFADALYTMLKIKDASKVEHYFWNTLRNIPSN